MEDGIFQIGMRDVTFIREIRVVMKYKQLSGLRFQITDFWITQAVAPCRNATALILTVLFSPFNKVICECPLKRYVKSCASHFFFYTTTSNRCVVIILGATLLFIIVTLP